MTSLAPHQPQPRLAGIQRITAHDRFAWMIVLIGFLLRLRRFLQDRGLMHDDAQLATNIFSRSFTQLLKPLNYGDQAAPVGFLILQKCSTTLLGHLKAYILLLFHYKSKLNTVCVTGNYYL